MIKKLILTVCSICLVYFMQAQPTVGLLSYDISNSYQGYTLIYPHNQSSTFLLDNCGEVVHTWIDSSFYRPGNTAYITSDGSIVRAKRNASIANDSILAGGGGAIIEKRAWNNDVIWSYEINSETERLHHDFTIKPNGNILAIVWEKISVEDAIQAGRDPASISQGKLWPDKIIELEPVSGDIVWEWHVMDHLIQDFDDTKDNFGVVSENPQKVDFNYQTNNGGADWMHSNALDYNAELKQIMISVPTFSELWVIDNSTTTAQAEGSFGGIYNKGGDLLYRVGNQQTYKMGTEEDQILYYQHDTHWTNEFIDESNPYYGNIVCFNNRVGTDFSSVEIFESSYDMYILGYEMFQGTFPPYEFTNTITHPMPQSMHSTGLSSAQLLPNGNVLICSGRQGYVFELTPDGRIVWEYITPLMGGQPVDQGTVLDINNNLTFRAFRYPEDYAAFEGKDLSPKGFIETLPIEDWCERLVSTSTPDIMSTKIYPNPADGSVNFTWDSGDIINIQIIDVLGRTRIEAKGNGGMKYLDISELEPNVYFVSIDNHAVRKLIVR